MLDIFQILENNRTIVFSHQEDQIIITWDGFCTLEMWEMMGDASVAWLPIYEKGLKKPPISFEEAKRIASDWHKFLNDSGTPYLMYST